MGKSTISMAIFNSYVKLPEGMSYVIVALLFNQSIPGIPWKSLHEPMGFMEEKKTIHDKDMVFAMVILHIIWICNGYTPYHIHIQLLPHSFIPSLSRWFSRHLTIFAIILPFQRSAPKPSPPARRSSPPGNEPPQSLPCAVMPSCVVIGEELCCCSNLAKR